MYTSSVENENHVMNPQHIVTDTELSQVSTSLDINMEQDISTPEQSETTPDYNSRYLGRSCPPEVEPFSIGKMDIICAFCEAYRFPKERLNCCHDGKVLLSSLPTYPPEMHELFTSNSALSKNFMENIRQYNSSVSFASFGAQLSTPTGRGPYTFRLHGQIYHRIGSLHPNNNSPPVYSQLYIIETRQAVKARLEFENNHGCCEDVMTMLTSTLDRINPYARQYRRMIDVEQEQNELAAQRASVAPVVTMYFLRGPDQRRYNNPTTDEIAAIWTSTDGAPKVKPDIIVYPSNRFPQKMNYRSPNIDPMVYPLFFPYGTLGWYYEMQHNPQKATPSRNKVTSLQFYAHRFAVRPGFNPIFYGCKLLQQFMVDAYVRTETGRLQYVKDKQSKFRVEMYQGLMDHIANQAQHTNQQPGRIVILPSSFQGSPRAMRANFQDAMTIVSKFGHPDLFLTFTANPRHRDIVNALLPGQQPNDRPDIVARVFKQHLEELLDDIKVKHILGQPVAMIYVVEFQKRGLPHCHMIIFLANDCKLRTEEDIDSVISAEIPDPIAQPELHAVIKSTMVHGPCGDRNPNSPCMCEGKCTKGYPKDFCGKTSLAVNGYPRYKRSKGRRIQVGNFDVDNRWIVPHNPYLSKKYAAHINIEACTSIKSIKYLFKYCYKGHDCANIKVTETNQITHEEVESFLDTRYLSAPEAAWRLFEYQLHGRSHAIVRLALHLPNQQPIYFAQGDHETALNEASRKDTMLTAYFKTNDNEVTPYTYAEFLYHFAWNSSSYQWTRRKQKMSKTLTCVYSVSPRY